MTQEINPRVNTGSSRIDAINVTPLAAALGAEVACGPLQSLAPAAVSAVKRAALHHLVLAFRNQRLSDTDLSAFGAHFGEFQIAPPLSNQLVNDGKAQEGGRIPGLPEITVVSNVVENGVALGGLGDGEVFWHSDMAGYEIPAHYTILHALEVPPAGGRTGFVNLYAAWDTLPSELRDRVRSLSLKHDMSVDANGNVRKRFESYAGADTRKLPGATHPLVRTHPETQSDLLFLGRRVKAWLVGLELDESEALIDRIWTHATRPEFTYFHNWRKGDVLMWDNRCVLHRREPFDPKARRIMHRVVIKGTEPPFREDAPQAPHPRAATFLYHRVTH